MTCDTKSNRLNCERTQHTRVMKRGNDDNEFRLVLGTAHRKKKRTASRNRQVDDAGTMRHTRYRPELAGVVKADAHPVRTRSIHCV